MAATNRPSILDSDDATLNSMTKETSISAIGDLLTYVRQLESNLEQASNKPTPNLGTEDRLRQQQQEASRRENVLVMRLTTKEQEVQDYLSKLEEMRMQAASTSRSVLLDPAVNVIFQRMRLELKQAKDQVEQSRQELNAWQFTQDSNTGKRLMAKCRTLIQENEELGKIVSAGRIGKLEGELAMTKTLHEELKANQREDQDLLLELDEDMEAMQSTIMVLQGQLKKMHQENVRLRQLMGLGVDGSLDEELAKKKEEQGIQDEEMVEKKEDQEQEKVAEENQETPFKEELTEKQEDREELKEKSEGRGSLDEELAQEKGEKIVHEPLDEVLPEKVEEQGELEEKKEQGSDQDQDQEMMDLTTLPNPNSQ